MTARKIITTPFPSDAEVADELGLSEKRMQRIKDLVNQVQKRSMLSKTNPKFKQKRIGLKHRKQQTK
jgi:hypothetical protein